MKKLVVVLMLGLLTSNLWAQDTRQLKRNIRNLALKVEDEVSFSEAGISELKETQSLLKQAYALLRDGTSTDPELYRRCVDFSYDRFRRTYNNSEAMDRSQNICKRVVDLEVLDFLYSKHFRDLSAGEAMQSAGEEATRGVERQLTLIEWAYKKHFRDVTSSSAASKAVGNIKAQRGRNGTSLACFERYYKIYFRDNNSTTAMDKASQACSREP